MMCKVCWAIILFIINYHTINTAIFVVINIINYIAIINATDFKLGVNHCLIGWIFSLHNPSACRIVQQLILCSLELVVISSGLLVWTWRYILFDSHSLFLLAAILTPTDEFQFWKECAQHGNKLRGKERASHFKDLFEDIAEVCFLLYNQWCICRHSKNAISLWNASQYISSVQRYDKWLFS